MKQTIKSYSKILSDSDFNQLTNIAKYYTKVKNEIFNQYGSVQGLQYINYPRQIRDKWVKTGYAIKFNLPARYWKQAFDEAWSNIKSNWQLCFNEVKKAIYRNKYLTKDEKKYCYYMLKAPELLYKIITNKLFVLPDKLKCLDIEPTINKWLKSKIRKYQNKKPYCKSANNFMLDTSMYNYSNNILYIMNLEPRKRIAVELTNKANFKHTIRIILKDNYIEIHEAIKVKPIQNWTQSKVIGIDKGFSELIHTSEDKAYGEQLNDLLKKESDRLSEKNKKRNKLYALAKKYEERNDYKKIRHIKKYNLGKIKYNAQKQSNKSKMKSYINHSLNIFFKEDKPSIIAIENLNFNNWYKPLYKKVKRYLASWVKGIIQSRIEFKAYKNKCKLAIVNPAYSSQICSYCGYLDVTNRKGDVFHCQYCGRALHAGYNASLNIANRINDGEITIFTPYKDVKQILLDRFNKSVGGSCKSATGSTMTLDTSTPDRNQSESEMQVKHIRISIDFI